MNNIETRYAKRTEEGGKTEKKEVLPFEREILNQYIIGLEKKKEKIGKDMENLAITKDNIKEWVKKHLKPVEEMVKVLPFAPDIIKKVVEISMEKTREKNEEKEKLIDKAIKEAEICRQIIIPILEMSSQHLKELPVNSQIISMKACELFEELLWEVIDNAKRKRGLGVYEIGGKKFLDETTFQTELELIRNEKIDVEWKKVMLKAEIEKFEWIINQELAAQGVKEKWSPNDPLTDEEMQKAINTILNRHRQIKARA